MNFARALIFTLLPAVVFAAPSSEAIDRVVLGDAASERAHSLVAKNSEVIAGGLGEPARRLLPNAPADWQGGTMAFILKVDPEKENYATIRFWGSDVTSNNLVLFCDGKQIGYRHLGDVEILDIGGGAPGYNDRFFYNTSPLPLALTRGKTELKFEIRCTGPTWGYGDTFERYQKSMTAPTRGLYGLTIHTDGFFTPPATDKQGVAPVNPPTRPGPDQEVLDVVKKRVDGEVKKLLGSSAPLNQMQTQFLARASLVKWTSAYANPKAVAQVLKSLDVTFAAYRKNPRLAESDPATPNADWFGLGPSGDAIRLLAAPLAPFLDASIDDGTGKQFTRRAAYSEMLVACREWHRRHRRLYTNQTMINDLYGIYLANRGIAVVDPKSAVPEGEIRRYLYESVGLEPWRDSDPGGNGAPERGGRSWAVGSDYWQLTAKGLTKELGYVGYYGEVLDWVTTIYEATRPAPGQPGDEKIRAQLIRIANARAVFRAPMLDADGYSAMRIETIIGWRDGGHYPGDVAYGERTSWDGSALYSVASTLDPEAIGYAQQMFADNQFFALVSDRLKETSLRVTAGLLGIPDQYELVRAQPPSPHRLPMTDGRPDFVFTDEEDGVVAVKHGDELLYVSLYWRAREAVNFLARVHFTTPRVDRIAVVREGAEFEPSGQTFARRDLVNFGFGNGGPRYPVEMHSALAGEVLPIAKLPEGLRFKPGDESVYAGKAAFYTLRYGAYLIAMNTTKDRTFALTPPAGVTIAQELVTNRSLALDAPIKVGPRSTVILRLP